MLTTILISRLNVCSMTVLCQRVYIPHWSEFVDPLLYPSIHIPNLGELRTSKLNLTRPSQSCKWKSQPYIMNQPNFRYSGFPRRRMLDTTFPHNSEHQQGLGTHRKRYNDLLNKPISSFNPDGYLFFPHLNTENHEKLEKNRLILQNQRMNLVSDDTNGISLDSMNLQNNIHNIEKNKLILPSQIVIKNLDVWNSISPNEVKCQNRGTISMFYESKKCPRPTVRVEEVNYELSTEGLFKSAICYENKKTNIKGSTDHYSIDAADSADQLLSNIEGNITITIKNDTIGNENPIVIDNLNDFPNIDEMNCNVQKSYSNYLKTDTTKPQIDQDAWLFPQLHKIGDHEYFIVVPPEILNTNKEDITRSYYYNPKAKTKGESKTLIIKVVDTNPFYETSSPSAILDPLQLYPTQFPKIISYHVNPYNHDPQSMEHQKHLIQRGEEHKSDATEFSRGLLSNLHDPQSNNSCYHAQEDFDSTYQTPLQILKNILQIHHEPTNTNHLKRNRRKTNSWRIRRPTKKRKREFVSSHNLSDKEHVHNKMKVNRILRFPNRNGDQKPFRQIESHLNSVSNLLKNVPKLYVSSEQRAITCFTQPTPKTTRKRTTTVPSTIKKSRPTIRTNATSRKTEGPPTGPRVLPDTGNRNPSKLQCEQRYRTPCVCSIESAVSDLNEIISKQNSDRSELLRTLALYTCKQYKPTNDSLKISADLKPRLITKKQNELIVDDAKGPKEIIKETFHALMTQGIPNEGMCR